MNSTSWNDLTEETKDAALDWRLRLGSQHAGDTDYEAFGEWIAADPSHAAAFAHIEALDGKLEQLRRTDLTRLDHLLDLPSARGPAAGAAQGRFRRFAAIAATLLVAVAGASLWFGLPRQGAETVTYASVEALRLVTLDDGTTVTLTPGASMDVVMRKGERRVTSFSGVGYFHVAPDKSRPFKIAFGDKTITVVGTQFEVRNRGGARSVAVAEGVVSVGDAGSGAAEEAARLVAGGRLSIASATTDAVIDTIDPATISAWRAGVLEFENEAMEAVVRRLGEIYGDSKFGLANTETAQLRFSGVLHLSDAESVARSLGELLPLKAVKRDGNYELMADSSDL